MWKRRILVVFILVFMISTIVSIPVFADTLAKDNWTVTGDEVVVDKTISIKGNLTIKSNARLMLKNTILNMDPKSTKSQLISVEPGGSIYIENCKITAADLQHTFAIKVEKGNFELKNSELQGLKIQGDSWTGWYGIEIRDSNNIKITGNKIHQGANVVAIQMHQCQKAVIENNEFISEMPANNISLDLLNSDDNSISNNTFQGPQGIVRLSQSWNNHVTNNTATVSGGGLGIVIDTGSGNNIIENNNIKALFTGVCTGIRILGTSYPNLISNNTIEGFRVGILMSYTSNTTVIGNRLTNIWQRDAIQLYRSYNNLVLNNKVDYSKSGITLLKSTGNTLQGNEIQGSSEWGIGLFYTSDNNTIEGNTVETTISNILVNVVADNSKGNSFSDNNIIGSVHQAYDNTGSNSWERNYWGGNDGKQSSAYKVEPKGVDNKPQASRLNGFTAPVPQFQPVPKETNLKTLDKHIVDAQAWKDRTVTLQGNLVIDSGASLSLDSVVINTDPMYTRNKSLMILVERGGTLSINNSKIIGPEKDGSLSIQVSQGAKAKITGSTLLNLGDWEGKAGLMVRAENTIIADNTFIGNCGAVTIENAGNCQVTGNKISEDFLGINIIVQGGVFKGNKITQTVYRGISLNNEREGITIIDNTLSDMWGIGIELNKQNSIVSNNTLDNIKGKAITAVQNSKELNSNSIKYAWAESDTSEGNKAVSNAAESSKAVSDTSEGNNGLSGMLLVGIGILAIFLLVLFKNVFRHINRS